MQRKLMLLATMLMILITIGCAPGLNESVNSVDRAGDVAGFWSGLWHGFIVVFTFVVSLLSDNVSVYEVHNNGNWYNLGFVLGAMLFFGGSGGSACKRKRCD